MSKKAKIIIIVSSIIFVIIGSLSAVIIKNNIDQKKADEKEAQKRKAEMIRLKEEEKKYKNIHEGRRPPMTEEELTIALQALANGITIADAQNDYAEVKEGVIQGDGRPDNPRPWAMPFTDLKNVTVGADDEYIYVKYQFYAVIPSELQRNDTDYITSVCINFDLINYYNHNINQIDGSGLMQTGITYAVGNKEDAKVNDQTPVYNPPVVGTSTFGAANSEVKDENGEDTYGISSGEGKVYGGAGFDYVIAAFPFSNLGLQKNQEIIFSVSAESGSKVYHHQSIDPLLDFGSYKSGKRITWVIGSNTYTSEIPNY